MTFFFCCFEKVSFFASRSARLAVPGGLGAETTKRSKAFGKMTREKMKKVKRKELPKGKSTIFCKWCVCLMYRCCFPLFVMVEAVVGCLLRCLFLTFRKFAGIVYKKDV